MWLSGRKVEVQFPSSWQVVPCIWKPWAGQIIDTFWQIWATRWSKLLQCHTRRTWVCLEAEMGGCSGQTDQLFNLNSQNPLEYIYIYHIGTDWYFNRINKISQLFLFLFHWTNPIVCTGSLSLREVLVRYWSAPGPITFVSKGVAKWRAACRGLSFHGVNQVNCEYSLVI